MLEYFLQFMPNFLDLAEHAEVKRIRKSEAISAVREALRITKKHIELTRVIDIDENYDDLASYHLAEKWADAAKLIRPFDSQFANTLENKAEYWTSPHGFRNDILSGNIQFDYRFRLNYVILDINRLERKFFR